MKKKNKIAAVTICLIVLLSLQGCTKGTLENDSVRSEETAETERESNSSVDALMKMLKDGPLSIKMSDYENMEKVGDIGTDLPTNDKPTKTKAGDMILYMGNQFVIYYAPNSWNFTRLGKIQDVTAAELKKILGGGDVTVTLSLAE